MMGKYRNTPVGGRCDRPDARRLQLVKCQRLIGSIITVVSASYLWHRYQMSVLDCLMVSMVGIGGLIYGDA